MDLSGREWHGRVGPLWPRKTCSSGTEVQIWPLVAVRGHRTFGPPLIPLKLPALKMMDEIGMTPAQRAKVMGGNAARLLKLN